MGPRRRGWDGIRSGVEPQSPSLESISAAVVRMDKVTQDSTAVAAEAAAASEELSVQAEDFLNLV